MDVDFSADKLTALQGENITFTDLSDQSPTHWSWRFSDGTTSIVQNPVKSFATLGFKNVTLMAGKIGAGGVNIKNSYIEILATFLLDVEINASIGFSLRKLRGAYTGSAIRVRRSSDNTEQDIGFNSLLELDTTALLSFVGAGNGFVTTWYDQSLNAKHATQTTAANQPQIVSSGSVILENAKPAINFNGTSSFLTISDVSFGNILDNISCFYVTKLNLLASNFPTLVAKSYNNDGSYTFGANSSNGNLQAWVDAQLHYLAVSDIRGSQTLLSNINLSGTNGIKIFKDSNLYQQTTQLSAISGTNSLPFTIGRNPQDANYYWNGTMQEIVNYPSDKTSSKTIIENNINTYYNVF
jgi:PKD repeat protein